MKYQLLWAACFVGLLQLSAVASRSTVDEEIINKENAKYSTTTVGPTVAYTGQEVERGVNSSGKLAVDPGTILREDYYYREDSNLPAFILIFFFCFVALSLIFGCILACCRRRRRTRPGMILSHQTVGRPSETQHLQPSSVYNQQQTFQQQNYQQQNYQQQNYQQQNYQQQNYQQQNYQQQIYQQQNYQQQNYQQHNLSTPEDLPPPYQSIDQCQQQPRAVSQYQPVHLHQGTQDQKGPPTVQAEALQDPSVVEFENPVSSVEQPEKSPLIKF